MPYHKVILNYIKKYVLSYIRGDKMLVETAQIMLQENVKYNDLFDRILVAQAIENDLTIGNYWWKYSIVWCKNYLVK